MDVVELDNALLVIPSVFVFRYLDLANLSSGVRTLPLQ